MTTPTSEQAPDHAVEAVTILELCDRLTNRSTDPLDDADALLTARLAVRHYSLDQSRLQNIDAIRQAVIDAMGFASRPARLRVVTECVELLAGTAV